jgi:hypothetical protein
MIPIEKIISRGVAGPELAALGVARLCGVATGGSTRMFRGRHSAGVIYRYGLAADPCSRRQALLRNIREAGGTLVFGRFGRALEALLKAERTHYCCIERLRENAAQRIVDWQQRHGIRTLNVVGCTGSVATFFARVVMLEVLQILGRRPRLPMTGAAPVKDAAVVAGRDTCYAVVPWPAPAAWRWRDGSEDWEAVADWKTLPPLRSLTRPLSWVARSFWERVPLHVRQWITCQHVTWGPFDNGEVVYDLDLLEVLGRLGKPADDLARAGRWAILRLVCESVFTLFANQSDERVWDAAAALLTRRQREIVGSFGFPATESAVQILAKMPKDSCRIEMLRALRTLLSDPASRRVLQSLPHVNLAVVSVLSSPWLRRIVGRRLLYTIASRIGDDACAPCMRGASLLVHRLQEEAERTGQMDELGVLNSLRSLERIVGEPQDRPDVCWPAPPPALPGIAGVIEPLAGGKALFVEGQAIKHCAGQYTHEVRQGYYLMYRILPNAACGTGRATLQLRPGPDGQWHVCQLHGAVNTLVSAATARFVETWLFFAQCDPGGSESELYRSCILEFGTASGIRYRAARSR